MIRYNTKRTCALCGDTCKTNVTELFTRDSDGKMFNVCLACREKGGFNAETDFIDPKKKPSVQWKFPIEEHPVYAAAVGTVRAKQSVRRARVLRLCLTPEEIKRRHG